MALYEKTISEKVVNQKTVTVSAKKDLTDSSLKVIINGDKVVLRQRLPVDISAMKELLTEVLALEIFK